MTLPRALALFRAIYVAFIVWASARTLHDALAGSHPADRAHAIVLASVEIVAALLLLWTRTERIACASLLAIYAIAAVLGTLQGELPLRFAYYAATACFIVFLGRRETPAGITRS